MIGDTRTDGLGDYPTEILSRIDSVKDNPNFDWRFVFYHIPGYSHSAENPYTPIFPPLTPAGTPDGRVRQALFDAGHSLAGADPGLNRHVTLVGSGHNHQYERVWVRYLTEPPPGSDQPSPLTQLVLGGGGGIPSHDPWTGIPAYDDAGLDSGVRKVPEEGDETVRWIGYALILVSPDDMPAVTRVISRHFYYDDVDQRLFPVFEEVINLPER